MIKRFICNWFGHRMYRVKRFFHLHYPPFYVSNFAIPTDLCDRCGRDPRLP